jgi:hypothetical protein
MRAIGALMSGKALTTKGQQIQEGTTPDPNLGETSAAVEFGNLPRFPPIGEALQLLRPWSGDRTRLP